MQEYLNENDEVIDFILEAGDHLKLTILPKTSACILFHKAIRKQCKKEIKLDKYLVGATCLYLASKIEEEPQKIRDVVNICYRCLHPTLEPLQIGKTYWNLRDSITHCELMLLRLFQFDVLFETPHKYLLQFVKSIENWAVRIDEWKRSNFAQICYNLTNDICHLPLIETQQPEMLATTIIYIVLQSTMLHIEEGEKRWFQIFCPNIREDELQSMSCRILQLYELKVK